MAEGKGTRIEERFGLRPEDLEQIRAVFRRHPEVREVRIFGSRATAQFEDSSDIDLALCGNLNPEIVGRIWTELDELPLPYAFDVEVYSTLRHPQLKRHIDETGKVLYRRQSSPVSP